MKVFGYAVFEGYLPQPSELNVKVPGNVNVQIFYERGSWRARSLPSKAEFKNSERPLAKTCAEQIAGRFEKQIEPWEWRDESGELTDCPDEVSLSHLIGLNHAQAGLKIGTRKTMCGKLVPLKRVAAEQNVNCQQCKIAVEKMRAEAK